MIGVAILMPVRTNGKIKGVTMPVYDEEPPRLSEIGRRILDMNASLGDFRSEVRAGIAELRDTMIRKDVHHSEHQVLETEIRSMKKEIQELKDRAKHFQNLLYSTIATVIASGAVGFISWGMSR